MTTTYVNPGPLSSFIPAIQADIQVEYVRNQDDFPINRYMGQRTVSLMKGDYMRFENNYQIRFPNGKMDRYTWADGAPNPALNGSSQLNKVAFLEYTCTRYGYGSSVGYLTKEQAVYDIAAQLAREQAMLAMTGRTLRAKSLLTTSGNYAAGNTNTMTAFPTVAGGTVGGNITSATSTNPYLRILIENAATLISQNSNTSIRPKDIALVTGPDVAMAINQSQEWIDFCKQQEGILQEWKGEGEYNSQWFLPDMIHGVQLHIEDAMINTSEIGAATQSRSYVWPAGTIVFLVQKNAVKPSTGSAFSAAEIFQYQPLTIESFDLPWNKLTLFDVVDNTAEVFVAPELACLVTSCV